MYALSFSALFAEQAAAHPDKTAYVFLGDGEEESNRITYGELAKRASAIASALVGARGDRALLLYPPGLEFVEAFLGCLHAGVIAVPFTPPRPRQPLDPWYAILRDSRARLVLTTGSQLDALHARLEDASRLEWLATDRVRSESPAPALHGHGVAFLQYTSGSTGAPKGVVVSHENLLANERMIAESFGHDEDTVVAGWLPFFHDMGLIGNLLQPLYVGGSAVLMPPVAFVQKPARWLWAISKYRATTSGGPNFAFDLCVSKAAGTEDLDLSSWRLAFNGSEPVRAETMDRFTEAFATSGFDGRAFFPCYGLAEATLLVTGGFRRDRAGSGKPPGNLDVICVDPQTSLRSQTGEIWVRGASVAQGYWGQNELTRQTFGARVADTGDGPYLRTGDLGFFREGELCISGRSKDTLIVRGCKHHPQDLEHTVERSHPALRPAACAVFALDDSRLVVAQEVSREHSRRLDAKDVIGEIRAAVSAAHGLGVDTVVLLLQGGLPKTSSGKVRRSACRDAFLDGSLTRASVFVSGHES